MRQYKVMSCFEQVALQQQNAALQAQVDSLMLEFCPKEMTNSQVDNWANKQRLLGDSVHDQLYQVLDEGLSYPPLTSSKQYERMEREKEKREQTEGDYLSWFIIIFFLSFFFGYIASYYHYV